MTHADKLRLMREHLTAMGLKESGFAPPAYRLMWRMGWDATPPLFASFLTNAALHGVFFGALWGLIMWFAFWSRQGMPGAIALVGSALAGLLFGLAMAAILRYRARKFGLPMWADYEGKSRQ
jgi:hypothetical protein